MTTQFPFQPPFDSDMTVALPGMPGRHMAGEFFPTGITEGAVIPGRFVCKGTATRGVRAINAAGDVTNLLRGVITRATVDGVDPYADKNLITYGRTCYIWVEMLATAPLVESTPGTIFIIHNIAGGNNGKVRIDAGAGNDTATAAPEGIKVARVLSTSLVELELRMPG